MSYSVRITKTADKDLNAAADYIEFNLCNPKAADDLLDRAEEEFAALVDMPQRYAVVDDPVLHNWGIRFLQINNYLAFYVVPEEAQTVYIVRFLYGKRDWISILRGGFTIA